MARRSDSPTPMPDAFDLGVRFLQARRAQNLSWMRAAEQSLRTLGDAQRAAGPSGASLARLSPANASLVRETADVYRLATAHLAR